MSDPGVRATSARLNLPLPKWFRLRNFSLYDNAPQITAEFSDGVFCLAGANGLGKSTFLAALNYAITGIVADPSRRFDSVDEYYRHSLSYADDFFSGRITDLDREAAEVELVMEVADATYTLTRGMFEPDGLRALSIVRGGEEAELDSLDDGARHELYKSSLAEDVGLSSFEQLVFLQHFVLTFDERRHLMFWDDTVMQSALFIAFGVELDHARRAEELRRTAERADSLARNAQWHATEIRNRLADLDKAADEVSRPDQETVDEHIQLTHSRDEARERWQQRQQGLRDAQLHLADTAARHTSLREEYERAFAEHAERRRPVALHPVVAMTIEGGTCRVCGTSSSEVVHEVRARVDSGACPLCDTQVTVTQDAPPDDATRLRSLDARLVQAGRELEEARLATDRLQGEVAEAERTLEEVAQHLLAFESANEEALLSVDSPGTTLQSLRDQYRQQIAERLEKKKRERARRDEARKHLKVLQKDLAGAYAEAEEDFVPSFVALAEEFLGLQVDVTFNTDGVQARLVLSVEDKRRRARDTLSESQRFFIDIALRMALARHMSGQPGACIYVDTPEGSLDIAYESRAGSMFGKFVDEGHRIIMTANINTSQLLLRLARTCGRESMRLRRMTDWTALSDVQIAEEELFDQAYAEIESALDDGR